MSPSIVLLRVGIVEILALPYSRFQEQDFLSVSQISIILVIAWTIVIFIMLS